MYVHLQYNSLMQTTIQVRVDEETREKAAKVFEAMGTDLSGGIKLFLNNVITEGSLGFIPMTEDGQKFKYFQDYKRKLARERRVWKELYGTK